MTQAMPEKKRKVYEVTEVNKLTGNRRLLTIARDRETAQWCRAKLEMLINCHGMTELMAEIVERDVEDDAEKTTEGVCGH